MMKKTPRPWRLWLACFGWPLGCGLVQAQSLPPLHAPANPASPTIQAADAQAHGLRQLVWDALQRDARVRESLANAESANQLTEQAKAALWPQLELNVASRSAALESSKTATPGGVGMTVTYKLFDFGRTEHNIQARTIQAEAMLLNTELTKNTTVHETAVSYLNLMRYTQLMDLQKQHMGDLALLKDKLSAIVEAFPGRRSELTQVLARLSQAENVWHDHAAKRREHQLNLLRLTGRSVEWAAGDAQWPAMPALSADALAQLIEQTQNKHPQVLAAQREAAALQSDAAQTRAAQKPQLDVQLTKTATAASGSTSSSAQLYMVARWNAFEGYAGQAQEKSQRARALSAEERAQQLQSELAHKLRSAWDDEQTNQRRAQDLAQLAQLTDQVRRDYHDQWRDLGRRSLLDVLTAESEHQATRTTQLNSLMDAAQAHVRLLHEAGTLRDWIVGRPA